MGRHRAPTNRRCSFKTSEGRCLRYSGHPKAPYGGIFGHRIKVKDYDREKYVYVCTRLDLAGALRRRV